MTLARRRLPGREPRLPRRARGPRWLGGLLALGAVVVVAWIALWWWGASGWRLSFALLALTPVVPVAALVLAVVAAATRRWVTAGAAALAVLVLGALVAPRAVPDEGAAPSPAAPLRVMTVNLQFGQADAAAVVALVRTRRVAVLSLQELTPEAERRLAEAGLFAELPYRLTAARVGPYGTGLAARLPLAPADVGLRPALFAQVAARLDAPDGRGGSVPVEVLAVHPAAPFTRDTGQRWAREITELPGPRPDRTRRVVLGDYNATLDHLPLRQLLATGYRDAAAVTGSGLTPTWPTDTVLPRFATIDHVLLAGTVAPADVTVVPLPGTDHASVIVGLDVGVGLHTGAAGAGGGAGASDASRSAGGAGR